MNRKQFLGTLVTAPLAAWALRAAPAPHVQVYKDPSCSCCAKWVEHLKQHGFTVSIETVPDTSVYRKKFGIPDNMASCHTGLIEGYALEGHVPAPEIQRVLKERPKAKGLAVPGMPLGSPGMEVGTTQQPYSVMLVDAQGKGSVYQRYPR
jgi:hypothetical protein